MTLLKCPINTILVTIEKKYQDKEKGLLIDTTYHPEEYATLNGIVHSVPDRLANEEWRDKSEMIIRPGDEIYFSYGVIYRYSRYEGNETPGYRNLVCYQGKEYWKVDYSEVFCIVREGKIIMPNQYVLLEPMKSEQQYSSSGLLLESAEYYQDRARVKAMPAVEVDCKEGDILPIETKFVQQYQMFGSLHYIIPVRRLIAKF
jgi:hypothetical protein